VGCEALDRFAFQLGWRADVALVEMGQEFLGLLDGDAELHFFWHW
jgi:hypothetical protein